MSEKLVEKMAEESVRKAQWEADLGQGIMRVSLENFAALGSNLGVNTGS